MKHRFSVYIILSFLISVVTTSCSSDNDNGSNPHQDIVLTSDLTTINQELNDFQFEMTHSLASNNFSDEKEANKNLVISPLSASMVLGILAKGAESDVANEIMSKMKISNQDSFNSLMNLFITSIPSLDKSSQVTLANALWINNNYPLSSSFTASTKKDFLAEIKYLDFSNNTSLLETVNSWIKQKTGGLIPNLPTDIDSNTLAIIASSFYFKSQWKAENEFQVKNTKNNVFNGYNAKVTRPFMHSNSKERRLGASEHYYATWIPFGNTAYSMMLVLPNEELTPEEACRFLTSEEMNTIYESSQECWVEVELPKFKIENTIDLKTFLQYLLPDNNDTNLIWNMFETPITGDVNFQQTVSFEIDEKGVTAAAVSSSVIGITSNIVDPEKMYKLVFDRPFYFFINENSTGACLLSGFIADL